MNHFRNREIYIKMRVCHKSVTHPFFRYTKINEFFDMANPGCVFFENYSFRMSKKAYFYVISNFPKNNLKFNAEKPYISSFICIFAK